MEIVMENRGIALSARFKCYSQCQRVGGRRGRRLYGKESNTLVLPQRSYTFEPIRRRNRLGHVAKLRQCGIRTTWSMTYRQACLGGEETCLPHPTMLLLMVIKARDRRARKSSVPHENNVNYNYINLIIYFILLLGHVLFTDTRNKDASSFASLILFCKLSMIISFWIKKIRTKEWI